MQKTHHIELGKKCHRQKKKKKKTILSVVKFTDGKPRHQLLLTNSNTQPTNKTKKQKNKKLAGELFCSNHSADGTLLSGWLLALCIWELELESAVL
jgi:hypothetical protein